jgi:hypothetical protein
VPLICAESGSDSQSTFDVALSQTEPLKRAQLACPCAQFGSHHSHGSKLTRSHQSDEEGRTWIGTN